MIQIASPPGGTSLIEQDETRPERRDPFYVSKAWLIWFTQSLIPRIQAAQQLLIAFEQTLLENQAASIVTRAVALGNLPAGTYRISYYARKTTIDGVGSSLTVTLGWTENGVAQILSGAAMAVDTTTSPQSGAITVSIDPASPITFATIYASTTPGTMKYKLAIMVERLS